MRKKILIGSLLVLTLLLLMPSIPAIQQKTIEEKAYSDFVEQLNDNPKFLFLYLLILSITNFRIFRFYFLLDISVESGSDPHFPDWVRIKHPIILVRVMMLFFTTYCWSEFWNNLSDKLNWNWDIVPY